jgi:hypothetical protein
MKKSGLLSLLNFTIPLPPFRKTQFDIVFDIINTASSKKKIRHDILAVAPLSSGEAAVTLFAALEAKWRKMRENNPDFAFALAAQFVSPFPASDHNLALALHFFNSIPLADLFDKRLRLDPSAYFERCLATGSTAVRTELKTFIRRSGVVVNHGKLDFLTTSGIPPFDFVNDIDPQLLAEILEYGMASPYCLHDILRLIARSNALHAQYFSGLVDLLYFEVAELGFDVPSVFEILGLPIDRTVIEMPWISQWDLHSLFSSVARSFTESGFGILLEATLDAIDTAFPSANVSEPVQSALVILVSFVAHIYCRPVASILRQVYSECDRQGNPAVLQGAVKNAIDRFWRQDLPLNHSVEVVRFALSISKAADVVSSHPTYVNSAVAIDRDLAYAIGPYLPPPPPLPTFLSFVKQGVFRDITDVCLRILPAETWVLAPGDDDLLNRLPESDVLAEKKPIIVSRLAALQRDSPDPLPPPALPQIPPPATFMFSAPEIAEASLRVRAGEPATVANLTAWLWHTGGVLPKGVTPSDLASVAAHFPSDLRLQTGFLCWAAAHGFSIDANSWKIRPLSYGIDFVAAVAALVLHARGPIRDFGRGLVRLIHLAFIVLGHPDFGSVPITLLARRDRGIGSFLAQNLIRLDSAAFPDLVTIDSDIDRLREVVTAGPPTGARSQFVYHLISAAGRVLCSPVVSPDIALEPLPVSAGETHQVRALEFEASPARRSVDRELVNAILTVMEVSSTARIRFVHLLSVIELTANELDRAREFFHIRESGVDTALRYRLPGAFDFRGRASITTAGELDADVALFFTGKPPSFTRSFCRCSVSQLIAPMRADFFAAIAPVLTPVFAPLAYPGFAAVGIRIEEGIPLARVRLRYFGEDLDAQIPAELESCTAEALSLFDAIVKLGSDGLCALASQSERDALVTGWILSAVSERSSIAYADRVIRRALKEFEVEFLVTVICTPQFLNQPNAACVFHIFRLFEEHLKAGDYGDFLEFCQVFHDETRDTIKDEKTKAAFKAMGSQEAIAMLLHR